MATRPKTAKSPATGDILKLKITLRGARPPIWRRVLVPANLTLHDLHTVIQDCMGFYDGHLHEFDIGGERYGDPSTTDDVENEARVGLASLRRRGIRKLRYTYDFGDDWEHDIAIEGSEPADPALRYPVCTAGKRSGPPEDCGGIWGYEELLTILADPAHPDREERLEWLGVEELDPEEFDLEEINRMLAARFNP